jgi:uncharacterized protein DUF29
MGSLYDQDLVLWAEEQGRALRAAARAGWNAPIDWENVAEEIERRLDESPSLRRDVTGIIAQETRRMRGLVHANCQEYGAQPRTDIGVLTYTEAQVLGDWLPETD